jgi:hypothetical protein
LAAAAREHGVDAAEDVSRGLDFAAVHCEKHAGGPVEEALPDGVAHCFYDLAGQPARLVGGLLGAGDVEGYVFEGDSNALDGLGAEGALGCGELESVDDFVGERVGREGVGVGFCCGCVSGG